MNHKKLAQNIEITTQKGEKIYATVPAFLEKGENLVITNIRITEPYELPDDYEFEETQGAK